MRLRRFAVAAAALAASSTGACGGDVPEQVADTAPAGPVSPDEPPMMLNREPPFRYPTALFARRVQGNVTLRLYVDSSGRVRPESTTVRESSGNAALDSAALRASSELTFSPARIGGVAVGTAVIFPVHFRHPDAQPLPGDSAPIRRARPG
jgi:protein TonB